MELLSWADMLERSPYRDTAAALTVGVFDGLHLGHRDIIARVVGNGAGWLPVVVTFRENPQNVMQAARPKKDILTTGQKLSIIESLGAAVAVMIDFSPDFSKMTAESFFTALASAFRIRKVVEGGNFHFGAGREAGPKTLRGFCDGIGAALERAPTVWYRSAPVSSTRIRRLIRLGLFADVRGMLVGDYTVVVPPGAGGGTEAGVLVTARRRLSQAVPERGFFRCRLETEKGSEETVVKIDKENIFIRSTASQVKTISFKEKSSQGFF